MQTAPKIVAKTLKLKERGIQILAPVLDMDMGQPQLAQAMIQTEIGLGREKEVCQMAMKKALPPCSCVTGTTESQIRY